MTPVHSGAGNSTRIGLCVALALCAIGLAAGSAAQAAEFYQGKTIRFIIGFAPGGGIDAIARPIGNHLGRAIPGNPSVVLQHMEGAGGIRSINFIANQAEADGLTIALPGRTWFIEGIIKSAGAKFDPTTLSYVGSVGASNSLVWIRSDAGINSVEDLQASKQPVIFGAHVASSQGSMAGALLAANGMPVKVIRGYNSSAAIVKALEQGEIQGTYMNEDAFALRPDLLATRTIIAILQSKRVRPGIPATEEFLRDADKPLLKLITAAETFGVPIVAPPNVPAEQLGMLQKAFLAMAKDAAYQAEVERLSKAPVGTPVDGPHVLKEMKELSASMTPELIAAYHRLRE